MDLDNSIEIEKLIEDLDRVNPAPQRLAAIRSLGEIGIPNAKVIKTLKGVTNDSDKAVRKLAKETVKKLEIILEITGQENLTLSELGEKRMLEKLLILQVQIKKETTILKEAIPIILIFLLALLVFLYPGR